MNLAYCVRKARETPYRRGEQRHYSCLVDKKGRIISEGRNSYLKTHTIMHRASRKLGLEKDFIHAEMYCLVMARKAGYKLYVARVDAEGNPANSEPCLVCKSLIDSAGVKVVEYTK